MFTWSQSIKKPKMLKNTALYRAVYLHFCLKDFTDFKECKQSRKRWNCEKIGDSSSEAQKPAMVPFVPTKLLIL